MEDNFDILAAARTVLYNQLYGASPETIEAVAKKAVDRFRDILETAGQNASGKTSDSIHFVHSGNTLSIIKGVDEPTLKQLIYGSKQKVTYPTIKQWAHDKKNRGLLSVEQKELNTFAYFVTKKINENGTLLHAERENFAGYSNTQLDSMWNDVIAEIMKEMTIAVKGELFKEINNILK